MSKSVGEYDVRYIFLICIICWNSIDFVYQMQAVEDCLRSDMEALMTFKSDLEDPGNRLVSWKGTNCCEWPGIKCDNSSTSVTTVDLSGYGLSGNINSSLTKLESLTYLDLSLNLFDAPIPDFFGSLSNLRYMNLSDAGFGSLVTPWLGNLSNLEYLDLSTGSSSLAMKSLKWLTDCRSLKHVAFNGVDLSMVGTDWLEDLNKLSQLNELHLSGCMLTGSGLIDSLSIVNFTSLSSIDFSSNSFYTKFPNWILNISGIRHINMMNASLDGSIPIGIAELTYLEYLNLDRNYKLSASSSALFKGSWPSIKNLNLASTKLHGKLPSDIGNMTTLVEFDLSYTDIEGGIPSSIGKLCNLKMIDLSMNYLTGSLPEYLFGAESCGLDSPLPNLSYLYLKANNLTGNLPAWLGRLGSLQDLILTYNSFQGPIPSSLGALSRLNTLELSWNNLNGTIPETFGQLSELSVLRLYSNQLSGVITEAHFTLMTNVVFLDLSSNSLTLKVGSNWEPPFQVTELDMGSCRIGPTFPTWLKSQKNLLWLDLSDNNLSGSIPTWFWDNFANISVLNISCNHLHGPIPADISQKMPYLTYLSISTNLLTGEIPASIGLMSFLGILDPSTNYLTGTLSPNISNMTYLKALDLSHNRLTGPIPTNIGQKMPKLIILSISNNLLTGEIPTSIGLMSLLQVLDLSTNDLSGTISQNILSLTNLKVLDLSNNSLSGSIPATIGQSTLLSIHLDNNQLSGAIPTTIQNLSNLKILDLSHNAFSGKISPWIGKEFENLKILNLRFNSFSGNIPHAISKLRSLRVLDLAKNKLTGSIPSVLGKLLGMAQRPLNNEYLIDESYRGDYYQESLIVNIGNIQQKYTKIVLSLVTSIDLSSNRLTGPFPDEITNLLCLQHLDLSRNKINGRIPDSISQMRDLTSLDFSNNKLSGPIPPSISSLTFLSAFNVSSNNLSGKIPESGQFSTFDQSAFERNPGLCGAPLTVKCTSNNNGQPSSHYNAGDDEDGLVYMSIGVGYAVGLVFPILILAAMKTWRLQYLKFVGLMVSS